MTRDMKARRNTNKKRRDPFLPTAGSSCICSGVRINPFLVLTLEISAISFILHIRAKYG